MPAAAQSEPLGAPLGAVLHCGGVYFGIDDDMSIQDRTSMTYWFPKLQEAGLPVPKTFMVQMFEPEAKDIWRAFDGQNTTEVSEPFFDRLKAATDLLGYPCFLRTSHTSGKHDWKNTCFLRAREQLKRHVVNIIEYGELMSFVGLPHEWWAVREYLPIIPFAICTKWGDMPVCREFRVFVKDGEVQCWHPYWPLHALEQGGADISAYTRLAECGDEHELLTLASAAGAVFADYWSIDILETERGLYITDMAEGEKSFHWEGCKWRK